MSTFNARIAVMAAAFAAMAVSAQARADEVDLSAEPHDGYGRIELTWPEYMSDVVIDADVDLRHGVMIAEFTRPIETDIDDIAERLSDYVAIARLDDDGATLRMALRAPARAHVSRSANVLAIDIVEPGQPDPPDIVSAMSRRLEAEEAERQREEAARARPPVALPLAVEVAEAADYSRIAFLFTSPVDYELIERGGRADIAFSVDAAPDLARMRIDPPAGMTGAEALHDDDRLTIRFALEDGYVARPWRDGRRIVVDIVPEGLATLESALAGLDAAIDGDIDAPGLSDHADAADHEASPGHDASSAHAPDSSDAVGEAETDYAALADNHHAEGDEAAHGDEHDVDHDAGGEEAASNADETEISPRVIHVQDAPVTVAVTPSGRDVMAAFAWREEVGAAVFRRGDVWWIIFDGVAEMEIGELRRSGGRHIRFVETISGEDYSGVRIGARPETQVSAEIEGLAWVFTIGEATPAPPTPSSLTRREQEDETSALVGRLDGVTAVIDAVDPEVGDHLVVATARGPIQGLLGRRVFTELTALPSAHGLAFELSADGVMARRLASGVELRRDGGLTLSAATAAQVFAASSVERGMAAESAGFIDFEGWGGPAIDFISREDELARAAAASDTPGEALLSLARFYMGHELAEEALGVIGVLLEREPFLINDPRVRALRGAALVLAGRLEPASQDLSVPALSSDRSAALWRGYLAAQRQQWRTARREFESGRDALSLLRSDWRARFLVSAAESALNLNDLAASQEYIQAALAENPPSEIRLAARLLSAQRSLALGDEATALASARAVASAGYEPIEVSALHFALQLEEQLGEISPEEAIDQLEQLRLRWRGDSVELEIARILGRAYVSAGEYQRGINMMRAARARFPNHPIARAIGHETADIFADLFLGERADELDPVQALALWYEFTDLTPIGPEGDRMIRRLADRLVEFDLLPQAAELLRHQVDNRLRGVARAQVATDLAAVYLMDRQADEALNTIRSSRHARLPHDLNLERRMIEARALAELGRHDHALELLATERSREARILRADISWTQRDWPAAAEALEAALGDAWRETGPMEEDVTRSVLRAAIAFSLADDEEGLARLDARYGRRMAEGPEANAWRVVTGRETDANGARLSEVVRRVAAIDTLDAFVAEFRARRAEALSEEEANNENGGAE